MKPHSDTIDSYNIYPTQKIWPIARLQQEDVMLYKQLWDLITKTFNASKYIVLIDRYSPGFISNIHQITDAFK